MVIKTLKKQNPLTDYGNIVTGDRFIGRKNCIETIRNRVLVNNGGNIAIMGLPRVGKSSLAWNALMIYKETYLKEKRIIIDITVGAIETSKYFFQTLICKIFDEIEFENIIDNNQLEKLSSIKDSILNEKTRDIEVKNYIQKFYKHLARLNVHIIYILDEFDHIGKIFRLENFQFLRELITKPDINIVLITISRRTIQEIELLENNALSKLAGVFSDLNLGLFNEKDITLYWQQLDNFGITTDNEYREKVQDFTGRHPYLLDMFNFYIIEEILQNPTINIYKIFDNKLKLTFFNQYDNIIHLLKEEKLDNKIIQLFFGPRYDLDQKSIEKLLKYGMIYKNNDGKYECFSKFFKEYLSLKQHEINVWSLWSETESKVRKLIKKKLSEKYGNDWKNEFLKKHPKKEGSLKKLEETMEKNQKNFPELASSHLVDYTYPKDMFEVFILVNWNDIYLHIFKGERKDWNDIFNHLAKIRNPLAHNNEYFIDDDDKNLAITYCKKILKNIEV
ncbi:MAG: ATP-binding protein [Sulfurovum sp.]|nr:MAG: ATP-binding protein [Sulfurovum sp.]